MLYVIANRKVAREIKANEGDDIEALIIDALINANADYVLNVQEPYVNLCTYAPDGYVSRLVNMRDYWHVIHPQTDEGLGSK